MVKSSKRKQTGSTACPYCGTPSPGSYSTVVEHDESGPVKILYKCNSCGRFYTAERIISWSVKKT